MAKRIECSACKDTPQYRRVCPECRGVGFHEYSECPAGINRLEVCISHMKFDPMVNGWECGKCNESGPL